MAAVSYIAWKDLNPIENIVEIERAQANVRALRAVSEETIRSLQQELSERDDYDNKSTKGLRASSLQGKLNAEMQAKDSLSDIENILLAEKRKSRSLLEALNTPKKKEKEVEKVIETGMEEGKVMATANEKEKVNEYEKEKDRDREREALITPEKVSPKSRMIENEAEKER